MSKSIRSVLEDLAKEQYDDGWCASNVDKPHDGPDYNAIDQALKDIAQIIDEVIGEDETVISQHYMAGNIEERTAFPDRRNRLRAEQRNRSKELLK